jgi:hypothetical protein
MRFLDKIWDDIRHGENIDQYATIIVALILVVLGLLGIAPAELIASLTLGVLGLLALSNLVNRHRLEALAEEVARSSQGFFLEDFPPDFKDDFQAATEVWLVGVTLSRFLKNNYGALEDKLRQGHLVKVLLVQPSGAPLEMAVNRYYAEVNRNVEAKSADIHHSLRLLCGLRRLAPQNVEIRTIHSPLTFGAIGLNPDAASGALYVEHYPYRMVADAQPKFVLRASDGYWYELFNAEIHTLWNDGEAWECQT